MPRESKRQHQFKPPFLSHLSHLPENRDYHFPGVDGAPWGALRHQQGGVGPHGDNRSGIPEGGGAVAGAGVGGDGDEGWSRGDSSLSPLIPAFLMKLFMSLPRHMGPQPDADGLLKALRERALPDKPRYLLYVYVRVRTISDKPRYLYVPMFAQRTNQGTRTDVCTYMQMFSLFVRW